MSDDIVLAYSRKGEKLMKNFILGLILSVMAGQVQASPLEGNYVLKKVYEENIRGVLISGVFQGRLSGKCYLFKYNTYFTEVDCIDHGIDYYDRKDINDYKKYLELKEKFDILGGGD